MGHMNVTENLRPLAERVGCGSWGVGHDTYQGDCFACWIKNGGGND